MRRLVVFLSLFASLASLAAAAQQDPLLPVQPPETIAPQPSAQAAPVSAEVAEAEAAIVKSDWKTAAAKLDLWLAAHPADGRALFDAGYAADADNRLQDAEGFYRRAAKANGRSFEAHLSLGLLLARVKRFDEARPELVMATHLDPGDAGPEMKARAWRALARIDRDTDAAEASNDLIEALKLSPETVDDTLLAAGLAEQSGELDAAAAGYRRVLSRDPKSAEAYVGLGHVLLARKQFAEAETQLRKALELLPGDPTLTAQLATALAAQDKAEALPMVQKLHEANPKNAAITRMLAEVLAVAGDAAGSDRLYVELLAASPKDAGLLVSHGQNLIRQLHYVEAQAAFEKATQLEPANGDAWSGLAFSASKNHQPEVTLHALTMRSRLMPEVPVTYYLWASSYDTLHQKAQAVTYYKHFLDASAGKFPDQEWQARQRIKLLEQTSGTAR